MRTTTESAYTSSSEMSGSSRVGTLTSRVSSCSSSLGSTPSRSRASTSTPAGVRSGTIVALSAELFGTRNVPLPRAKTV